MYWLAGNRRCSPSGFVEHSVDTNSWGALVRKVFSRCFSIFKIPILALLPYAKESQEGAPFQFFRFKSCTVFASPAV